MPLIELEGGRHGLRRAAGDGAGLWDGGHASVSNNKDNQLENVCFHTLVHWLDTYTRKRHATQPEMSMYHLPICPYRFRLLCSKKYHLCLLLFTSYRTGLPLASEHTAVARQLPYMLTSTTGWQYHSSRHNASDYWFRSQKLIEMELASLP